MKKIRYSLYILFFHIFFLGNCSLLFYRNASVQPVDFDYKKIASIHFNENNLHPFPLTVKKGVNSYASTDREARYLFFAGNGTGNFNIYFRDLHTSVTVPITLHPSEETKPAISPDGKRLAFVSERYDSNGDILVLEVDPEYLKEKYLKGNRVTAQDKTINATSKDNPRAIDTDPTWSSDGRYILFVTDRFTPGTTNVAVIDTLNDYKITQITQNGAASPSFSHDGKSIFYVSYKDHKLGEIYRIDIGKKEEIRITFNDFKDLSPSLSPDGKSLIYTSIRRDTNRNGRLDSGDHASVIKHYFENQKEVELTPGTYSLFDTRYSTLNGGSILFTAGINNALNVYFIPIDGVIPKRNNPREQYKQSLKYENTHSYYYRTAVESIQNFHPDDELSPLFIAKAELNLLKEYLKEGRNSEYNELKSTMLKKKNDPIYALSYVYAFSYDEFRNYRNPVPSLLGSYESWKRNKNVNPQLLSAIQYRIASMQFKNKDYLNAERTYRNILVEYPNFYDSIELKKNIGSIEFKRSQNKIPNYYIEVLNNKDATRYDNKTIIQDIIDRFKSIPNRNQRIEIISLLLKEQKEIQRNKELYSLLKYLQAEAHYKNNHFEKSLEHIQSYIHNVDSKSYVYLISHLLESRIYRAEEKIIESQKELEYFIKNYNYESGIDVDYSLIEDSLIFYESRARMFEIEGDYKSAIATYNENDEILALSKESKIPIQEIYNKYGTYFQKKYVDSTIDFAFKKNLSEEDFILNQMNIGKDLDTITTTNLARIYGLPIIGELSKPFGDFRDLQFSEWFSKDESKSALEYFESKLDKARSHLDLGTIYGYAYLLTSRAVLLEKKLQDNQSLTLSKKKKILKELKQAEYELNWIIHADPTFTDAYMLLGWIYQYVDISKKRPSYPSGEAEIEEFESAYIATFPTNYLEENVELFNQLLEFLGKNANDKTKFDIHVNLANNFFLLNNYQKSKKNFEIAESLSKSVIKKAAFNDYKKEALFHFNFGRTEIYNGNEAIAIPHFEKAIDLYYNNEYFPSVSQAGNSPNLESLVKLSEAKRKLALLHAIKGSSELNIKNYENSIQSFTVALSMNGFSEYIEDLSLYNALAIAHQKLGNINESDKYLKEAFENYESRRERFKFPSLSIWNLILPEKNRVIGDGKIPGELSLEFNHLLSRGIQIKNNTIEKEFTYTEELIQSRNQWIKDNGMDNTVLGKIILENSLNEIAYNQFLRGNYKRSNELYLQDYELAKKNGNDKLAFQFLKRASLSLFSLIEENREDIDYLIEILHSEIYKLNELKNIEINLCLSRNKNVTNCEKEFKDQFNQFEVILGYNYFYLGEFYSHKNETERAFYYYGIALSKLDNPNQIKPELIGLSQDIFNKKQRTRLKIAVPIIHLKMGETEKFKEELNEAYYFADQFYQERELLHILILQAEYDYKYAKTNQDYWRSLNRLNKATEILKNNPGLYLEINESSIGYLFKLKNYNNIKLKNYKNLAKDREALFSAIFFRQLVTNQFHFREKKTTELLNQLKYSIRKDSNYIKKMEDALTLGLQIQRVEKAKKENYLDFQRIAKDFQDSTPLKINILAWINPPDTKITNLNTDETFVEIYKSDNKVLLLLDNEKVTKNKEFSIQEGESLEIRLGYELENILKNFPNTKSLAISPPPSLHSFNFFQIQYKNKNLNESFPLRFIPRRGALSPIESPGTILKRITSIDTTEIEKSKNDEFLFNPMEFILSPFTTPKKIKSDLNFRIIPTYQTRSFIDDSNVIEGPTDFTNRKQFLGESRYGYLTIKDIVEEQNYVEVVVLNNYQPNRDHYMKVSFLLDILQMSGVNSLLLIPGSEDSEKKRNELLLNINQASTIAQKEQIFIFGKPIIKRNTKSQESNLDEITVLNKKAILLEREEKWTESLRYLLQANSLIDRQDQDIQIYQEIHIARIKSKKRTNNIMDPFLFLLDEFEKSGKARKDILLNATIHCYIYSKPQECEKYYNAFLKENTSSKDESKILDFYRNLAIGNKNYIYENYSEFIKLTKIKDPLLYHIDLAKMFLKQFMWKYANDHIELANNEARTKSEQSIALKIKSQLLWEKYFITGKYNKDLSFNSDRLYSRAINKNWNALETELENELNSTENYFRKNYLKRIYNSYKKLKSESDFEPINLGPLYLKDGSSSQILLDEAERSFLFFTLTSSIPYQKGKELNNNFDILHKSEISQGNTNRANWMLIEWASYLYYNGDKENAKNYFQKFEKNFKYSKEEIVGVYSNLKYKLSLHFNDIKITKEDLNIFKQTNPEWQKDYTLTSQLEKSSEFMPFIINSIQSKNVELDDYTNRQIFDLIEILMKKSLSSKDNATFIELGFLKEKIRSYNTKTLGKIPSTGQLNLKWKPIVQGLVQKLPQDQSIKGILDLGVESYSFTIENKKIDIQPAISDNRIVKFDNYRYLYSIKNEGGTIAQQKVLEKKYRNILKFNNLQITYLYLPSYHFKVTIKPRRLDRFVYFLNPDQLLENPIYNSAKDFQGDFPIKNMNISTRNDLAWKKKLDLESMEINYRNGLANTKPFIVSAEDLELSMGKQIKFGGRDLQSVKFIPVRNGCWIHTGSLLVNTSLKTDDMAHSLYFWDRLHYGPGIVNVADSTDTHVAYFLKEFLTKKYNDRNYHERYYLAYESLKNNWKEDRYWNGWKTYTNTFIMDKNP